MLATAIIVFREILEAALIIGIVAAATQGVLRRGWWISAGIALGVVGAFIVAGLAEVIVEWADGMGQELFNASVLLAAVLMLAWHNIWMASHSRELVAQMKQVGSAVKEGGEPMLALVLVIAVAVLREGSEIVLFLHGQAAQGLGAAAMFSGSMAGLGVGMVVGLALYFGLLRIPTKYLFTVTGWMILLLAAGMASQAAKFLVQADMLPGWGRMWDSSAFLANDSLVGSLLHTLVGYDASPMGMQVAIYLLTVILIGAAMKIVEQKDTQSSAKALGSGVVALVLALVLSAPHETQAGPASTIYTPNVELGEMEFEFHGGYENDGGDGEREDKFGIGYGVTQNWFTEVEAEWEKEHGEGNTYTGFEWVNIFKLSETGEYFVDLGLFTELKFPDEHRDADKLEIGPMFQKQMGAATYNLNLIWVRDYGSYADHNTEFEYRFQARVKGDPMLEYGMQVFGETGDWDDMNDVHDQELKLGPAIFGEVKSGHGADKIAYNAAFLVGATDDTADYNVRFTVEYEMY